jgi:hypothetical protein
MRHRVALFLSAALLLGWCGAAGADEKKEDGPLALKLVAKKDVYAWDAGGKTPKEFKKELEDIAEALKKNPRPPVKLPNPPAVDLMLQVVNNGKEDVTVYVGGDPNVYTLELKGPGVMEFMGQGPVTLELRLPKATKLAPGKSYDIPITQLKDGFRGAARNLYWTAPGEYTITATYQLSDAKGGKGALLKSEAVKVKVEEKKGEEKK